MLPQLCNHLEALFVAFMLGRANRKLSRLAWSSAGETSNAITILRFQVACINMLVLFLLMDVGGLATINVDVMLLTFADGSGPIFKSQFASDVSISIFSVGTTDPHDSSAANLCTTP